MGRKVHPYGFRIGVSRTWTAKWYADKDYTNLLKEDIAIRQLVQKRLANASVSQVEIERGIDARAARRALQHPDPGLGPLGQGVRSGNPRRAGAQNQNLGRRGHGKVSVEIGSEMASRVRRRPPEIRRTSAPNRPAR